MPARERIASSVAVSIVSTTVVLAVLWHLSHENQTLRAEIRQHRAYIAERDAKWGEKIDAILERVVK
jgi:hypothetical protein